MKKLLLRIVLGVAAGVAVYIAFSVWAGARQVGSALASFAWPAFAGAVLLAFGNYLIRFIRWHHYLRVLKLNVPWGQSFLVFLSGFSLTVTPGKLGEAVKALLLREARGIPAARTAPIVIAERLTDLVGCLLLATLGAFSFDVDRRFLVVGAVLVAVALLFVSVEALAEFALSIAARTPGVKRHAAKLREFHSHTAALVRPAPLLIGGTLATGAWALECLSFWLVVHGFPGTELSVRAAMFIYATMTVAGALSFLPGGLGVTEAGMLGLLTKLGTGIGRGTGAAATFLTRAATLWFAVALGIGALVLFARRTHVAVALPGNPEPDPVQG